MHCHAIDAASRWLYIMQLAHAPLRSILLMRPAPKKEIRYAS
jgi:hypothetical protein